MRLAHVLAVTLLALPAQAELLEVDLLAPGDKLITRDTETGLDWLDLGGVTTNLSYDAVHGGAGGWLASGWRYATEAEVCALFVAHAGVLACDFDSGLLTVEPLAAEALITRLAWTGSTTVPELEVFVHGLYDDATANATVGSARLRVQAAFSPPPFTFFRLISETTADAVAADAPSATVGSFLVRATPPEVPALPPAAFVVLA